MSPKAFLYALVAVAMYVGNSAADGDAANAADAIAIRDRAFWRNRARERRNRLRQGRGRILNAVLNSFEYAESSATYDYGNVTVAESESTLPANSTSLTLNATDTFTFVPSF